MYVALLKLFVHSDTFSFVSELIHLTINSLNSTRQPSQAHKDIIIYNSKILDLLRTLVLKILGFGAALLHHVRGCIEGGLVRPLRRQAPNFKPKQSTSHYPKCFLAVCFGSCSVLCIFSIKGCHALV
jgi:hypothetical protein